MGIFDFIQKGAQEQFIARPDEAKRVLVWKWPDHTIPMKAQLTVMEDEVAFFYKDGKNQGMVNGGQRITLETSNLPFLNRLVDKLTGGNMWRAEVWFVTTREMAGYKFGGKIGAVEDPKSGVPVETRVHGNFSLKVVDPEKAIKFFGTKSVATDDEFEGFFRDQVLKVIRDRIAELLVKKKWPLLDVTSGAYTEEIEAEVLVGAKAHLDRYGVEAQQLGNFEIGIDEADAANLKKLYTDVAYMRSTGTTFQQYAAGKAMLGAGEGMARGGGDGGGNNPMLGGAGLGVGFGMAQMFQQQNMQQPPQQQYQQQPPPQQQQQQAPAGPSLVTCGSCSKQVAPGKFCAECGGALAPAKVFCANCGTQMPGGAKFCSGCGNKTA